MQYKMGEKDMIQSRFHTLALVSLAIFAPALCAAGDALPSPVLDTLERRFPGASVEEFGMESERGIAYYEIQLSDGGHLFEVEIATDGTVGETEAVVTFSSLPPDHQELIRAAVGRGEVREIERHVRIGIPRAGTFVPVAEAAAFYDVSYRVGGLNRSVQLPLAPEQAWALDEEDDDGDGENPGD
jgi:hypothetical protein